MQVDVRLLPPESFGAAMQYFTGSKAHNVALRMRALKMGYTLNEYTLATLEGEVGLHGSYALSGRVELFARIVNALDARYATFGVLGDPTGVGAPGVPAGGSAGIDNRFQSPASPFSAYGGISARF